MKYSFDTLFNYTVEKDGIQVDCTKLECKFQAEEEIKNVTIEIYDGNQMTVKIVEEESDELTKDDRELFYYLLDKWIMNNLLI